eukprot:8024073-Lingulodinium_polyedra.AAC.1
MQPACKGRRLSEADRALCSLCRFCDAVLISLQDGFGLVAQLLTAPGQTHSDLELRPRVLLIVGWVVQFQTFLRCARTFVL